VAADLGTAMKQLWRAAQCESKSELSPVRSLLSYLSTALRLGATNVARVVIYRTCKRARITAGCFRRAKRFRLSFELIC